MTFVANTTPTFGKQPRAGCINFVQGTDTAGTYKASFTAGANGSKVVAVIVASGDTAVAHKMTMAYNNATTRFIIGSLTIPINSGTDGSTPSVDLLAGLTTATGTPINNGLPLDNDGQKYLFIEVGSTLDFTFATALTASTRIDVTIIYADF